MLVARCNECKNCLHVRVVQRRMLAAVNQAANKGRAVDDDVVLLWNATLQEHPCERNKDVKPNATPRR